MNNHGGKRKGAGRKSNWKENQTNLFGERIPGAGIPKSRQKNPLQKDPPPSAPTKDSGATEGTDKAGASQAWEDNDMSTATTPTTLTSPLDVSTRKERSIFNEYMQQNPGNPTAGSLKTLAKLFKQKADYKTVFPKLPSQLSRHYKEWREKQDVVLAKVSMKVPYYELLKQFGLPQSNISNAARYQKEASEKTQQEKRKTRKKSRTEAHPATERPGTDSNNNVPVPPVNAPGQTTYIASKPDLRKDGGRQCCAAAFGCIRPANVCGYHKVDDCLGVRNGSIKLPSNKAELDSIKNAYRVERKNKRQRERIKEKEKNE